MSDGDAQNDRAGELQTKKPLLLPPQSHTIAKRDCMDVCMCACVHVLRHSAV